MESEAEARERALARAGRALARQPLSRARVEATLQAVAPREVADAVLADLVRYGYVDDASLALSVARRRLEQGWGAGRVEHDLERLGVSAEAAAAALETARAEEVAAARALLRRRATGSDPRRAWALLARRGFAAEVAEEIAGGDLLDESWDGA